MKRMILAVFMVLALSAQSDVFSDAALWYHFNRDDNGDGLAQATEMRDTRYAADLSDAPHVKGVSNASEALFVSGGTVDCAYRNTTMSNQTYLHLRQNFTPNADGVLTGRVSCLELPAWYKNGINNHPYSAFIRFRWDGFIMPGPGDSIVSAWLLKIGFNWDLGRGILIGFRKNFDSNKEAAHSPEVYIGRWNWVDWSIVLKTNCWYDLAVSVTNVTAAPLIALAQAGGTLRIITTPTPDKMASNTCALDADSVLIGSEKSVNTAITWSSGGNERKAFRGAVSQAAFWNRALSMDEIRETFSGWNRWRMGSVNGSSGEFAARGEDAAAAFDPINGCWQDFDGIITADKQARNLTFMLRGSDAKRPQLLRVFSVNDVVPQALQAVLNGTTPLSAAVRPATGGFGCEWFIPADRIVSGVNTLTLTRTVAAPDEFKIDAIELTGSVGVGVPGLGHAGNFEHEDKAPADYYATDGNWKHLRRAILGSTGATLPASSNIVIHVNVPADLAARYDFRFSTRFSDAGNQAMPLVLRVNGVRVAETSDTSRFVTFSYDIPRGELRAGDNTFEWASEGVNMTGAVYVTFDHHALEILPKTSGNLLIIR